MRTDPEIRAVLLPAIRAGRPGAQLVQEWGLNYNLVADVAAVGADLVEAWEIKSAADSVARLPRQVPLYSALFDRCTLVTARSHMAHAARTLPLWWGLTLAEDGQLEVARAAEPNPGPYSTAGLLWVAELRGIAFQFTGNGRRWVKSQLLRYVAQRPPAEIAPLVCAALRARTEWRTESGHHVERIARQERRRERFSA